MMQVLPLSDFLYNQDLLFYDEEIDYPKNKNTVNDTNIGNREILDTCNTLQFL